MVQEVTNRIRSKLMFWKKPGLSEEERKEGELHRRQIIQDAEAMKRLEQYPEFKRFCELLKEDKEYLIKNLLAEDDKNIKTSDQRTRLIARVYQIDKILNKTKGLVWQVENLTEVRAAIQEQTHVRQAHGNKTGGQNE